MKNSKTLLLAALLLGAFMTTSLTADPLGTTINYQGRLEKNGQPGQPVLDGVYQMNVSLFAQPSPPGAALASNPGLLVPVTNGLFAVDLNFGDMGFTGEARWMEIAVRTNNNALPFEVLT